MNEPWVQTDHDSGAWDTKGCGLGSVHRSEFEINMMKDMRTSIMLKVGDEVDDDIDSDHWSEYGDRGDDDVVVGITDDLCCWQRLGLVKCLWINYESQLLYFIHHCSHDSYESPVSNVIMINTMMMSVRAWIRWEKES